MWPGAACAGPALTVRCAPGDNLAVHAAVATLRSGEVLVAHGEGVGDRGYWGEVLTVAAQARGAAGLIIDTCVRDTQALAARGFPVFAAGVALPGATKSGPGAVGQPVTIGGTRVELGDIVVADADGVVVCAATAVEGILTAARERADGEQAMSAELAAGGTTVELLGLDLRSIEQHRGIG
jgi:4-hydroxy-4-methyl-2-oxoglutarate aldolase